MSFAPFLCGSALTLTDRLFFAQGETTLTAVVLQPLAA
jgi:hypothetical protein